MSGAHSFMKLLQTSHYRGQISLHPSSKGDLIGTLGLLQF